MADLAITTRAYDADFQDPGDFGFGRFEVMAITDTLSSRLVLDREIFAMVGGFITGAASQGNLFFPATLFYAESHVAVVALQRDLFLAIDTNTGSCTSQVIAADSIDGYYITGFRAMVPGSDGYTYLILAADEGDASVWVILRALPGDSFTFLVSVPETIPSSPEVFLDHLSLNFSSTSGTSNYLHFSTPVLDIVDGVMTLPASEGGGTCRAVNLVLETGEVELRGFAPPESYLIDVFARYTRGLSYYDPMDGESAGPVYDLDGFEISPLTDNFNPSSYARPLGTGPTQGYMRQDLDGPDAHLMYNATTRGFTSIPDSSFGATACIRAVAGGKYLKFSWSEDDLAARIYGYGSLGDLASNSGATMVMEKPYGVFEDVVPGESRTNYSFRVVGATTGGSTPPPPPLGRFWTGYRNTNEFSETP